MKKQALFLLTCLILGLIPVRAQLRIALTGGLQRSSVPGNGSPGWDTLNYKFQSRDGYRIGVLADWHFTPRSVFYLQSGMFYSTKGRNFSASYDSSTSAIASVKAAQHLNYLEMPLNLVMKLKLAKKLKFTAGGGPYVGFLYSGRERRQFNYTNGQVQTLLNTDLKVTTAAQTYNNVDYGWNATAGFEWGRFIVSAHYTQGLKDFYKGVSNGAYQNRTMSASVGFFLNKETTRKTIRKPSPPRVKKDNKPADRDGDGVPDKADACPELTGTAFTKGCPDADGDSIPDHEDWCPATKGLARYHGCPIPDTDRDGVNDEEDKCPDMAGVARNGGCPMPDTDSDGVNDEEDKCPSTPGVARYKGCPVPDTDNDGVNDEKDKCPKVKGVEENKGCPLLNKQIIKKVETAARRIQFEYKSVLLTKSSKKVLDEVVAILKQNPDLYIYIDGHTSADGNPDNHLKLSQARANSVRIYLMSKGVAPNRMKAEGFGATRPLDPGQTPAQLARNRRVEMRLTNHEADF